MALNDLAPVPLKAFHGGIQGLEFAQALHVQLRSPQDIDPDGSGGRVYDRRF